MFHIRQKVVCVDATQPKLGGPDHKLKKGAVYTVAAIGLTNQHDAKKLPCISVEEHHDNAQPSGLAHLWAHRFRPLIEKKLSTETGMAILRRIAADASQKKEIVA